MRAGAGLTAIVGPSGAGKTTLLHLIAGLIRPDAGRSPSATTCWSTSARGVFVPPDRRRIGYVTQESRLFPHLTVRQNLGYGHWFTPLPARRLTLPAVVACSTSTSSWRAVRPASRAASASASPSAGR